MKKILRTLLCITCLLPLSFTSAEETKKSPIDDFKSTSNYYSYMCSADADIAFSKAIIASYSEGQEKTEEAEQAFSKMRGCIDEAKIEMKKRFPLARAKLAKKAASSKLLQEFFVAWTSEIDGIKPLPNELKINYARRQNDASQKSKEAWIRFDIESGS